MSNYSDIKKIIFAEWPKSKIKSIKEFTEGYNNVAYDIRLDKGNYVIKLIQLKDFERYALKQKHIRTMIRKKFKSFPIPKMIKSDYSKKIINKPYIITEKVEGKSLQSLYKKIKNKEELYKEIGELYGKIHSFKFKNYGELDSSLNLVKGYLDWYTIRCNDVKKSFEKIKKNKLLSKKVLKINQDFFAKNKFLIKKETSPCLCHGDASDTNMIIRKSGQRYKVNGIIDFEFARISGATHDLFSGLRSFEKKYKYRNSLTEGYTKWSQLPKEWEKLIFLYNWIGHLNQLTNIKNMKWRNLNEADTLRRKKDLRKKSLIVLRETTKNRYFMKSLLLNGKISPLIPKTGGGLSGETHLIKYCRKKYVLRICPSEKRAKSYESISKKLSAYNILPKLIERNGKNIFYEYLRREFENFQRGRDYLCEDKYSKM